MTTTAIIPQGGTELTPDEAQKLFLAQAGLDNRASNKRTADRAVGFVREVCTQNQSVMMPLMKLWRLITYQLAGNSLSRSSPEDVHVPELYKAMETIVPRIEEAVTERRPWFRVVPRRPLFRGGAEAIAGLVDWQFDQANIVSTIQPAIRSMLIYQVGIWHGRWEVRRRMKSVTTMEKTWEKELLVRKFSTERKEVIDYVGPAVDLVDPLDFIIHKRATDAQDAIYVGHRAYVSVDEVRRIGKQLGWINIGKELDGYVGKRSEWATQIYKDFRDPLERSSAQLDMALTKGRPGEIELTILYSRYDLEGNGKFIDCRIVTTCGQLLHEIGENNEDFRPYAIAHNARNGFSFYGTGHFDNAVRLNQHFDSWHQNFLRGAKMTASPMAFAEEDSEELPESIYQIPPGHIFKGVGNVRFTSVPDGFIRSAPLVLQTMQRNIEEVVGSFRLNMGQDTNGTATEATLSLQEGNRRTRGLVRGFGDGLGQLLQMFYRFNQKYHYDEVEYPVLGKRAFALHTDYVKVGPQHLLDDVKFDLVGLHSLRNNGLKAVGLNALVNGYTPFMVGNPNVDTTVLLHKAASELIGPDDADEIVKMKTPPELLISQDEENEALVLGEHIEVNPDDHHDDHRKKLLPLFMAAMDPKSKMQKGVRMAVIEHWMNHGLYAERQRIQEQAMEDRQPTTQQPTAPEAGGTPAANGSGSSPRAGGFSDAIQQLADMPGGQVPMENPGPADSRKYGRSGRTGRTTNQTENV